MSQVFTFNIKLENNIDNKSPPTNPIQISPKSDMTNDWADYTGCYPDDCSSICTFMLLVEFEEEKERRAAAAALALELAELAERDREDTHSPADDHPCPTDISDLNDNQNIKSRGRKMFSKTLGKKLNFLSNTRCPLVERANVLKCMEKSKKKNARQKKACSVIGGRKTNVKVTEVY